MFRRCKNRIAFKSCAAMQTKKSNPDKILSFLGQSNKEKKFIKTTGENAKKNRNLKVEQRWWCLYMLEGQVVLICVQSTMSRRFFRLFSRSFC